MSAVTNQNSQSIVENRNSCNTKVCAFLGCTVSTLTTLGGVMGTLDPRHANRELPYIAIGVGSSMMLLTIIITLVMRKRLQQENYVRI